MCSSFGLVTSSERTNGLDVEMDEYIGVEKYEELWCMDIC